MAIRFMNRRLQFSLMTLFVVTTAVAVFLGVTPVVRMEWALRNVSNKNVDVNAGYLGLDLMVESPPAEKLRNYGQRANGVLERALADSNKFAVAHVLLTDINTNSYYMSSSHWNEMQVDFFADGRVDFHKEQIPKLQEFWRNQLHQNGSNSTIK